VTLAAEAPADVFLPPANFLALTGERSDRAVSRVLILPIPYEGTVSYEGGTGQGPEAIIRASAQVELYDLEFDAEPALLFGVHTLPALAPHRESPEAMVERIAECVAGLTEEARAGKLLVGLGGEHTVSVGFGRGLARIFGMPLTTVQLDAHADLRDAYEGSTYSHACTARRLLELGPVIQLGVRSLSAEEAAFIKANSPSERRSNWVRAFFAEEVHARTAYLSELADLVRGRPVFLSLDVDVFDPSLVPATGTPVPGGLSWGQVLDIVRVIARHARVVGFDCVELAPRPGLHASDFLAAQLVYKTMSLIMMSRERQVALSNL